MANLELLSKRLLNWPDQSKLRTADNGAELARVATVLGLPVDEVKAAVQQLVSSGFGAAAGQSNALQGDSANAEPAPQGDLGWATGTADARGPEGIPLVTFLLDISSFERASPEAERALTRYVGSFGVEPAVAEAAAKTILAAVLIQTPPSALMPAARAALDKLSEVTRSLSGQVTLAKKQLLSAKATALGKAFYEPGSFRQLKQPAISHAELSDSAVTNPAIEQAKRALAQVEATHAEASALTSELLSAGELFPR